MTFPTATVFPVKVNIVDLLRGSIIVKNNKIVSTLGYKHLSPSVRSVNLPSCGKSANFSMHIKLFTCETHYDKDVKMAGNKKERRKSNFAIQVNKRNKPEYGT